MHPNGQLPAYEWNFGDVNPPVHAWSVFRVFKTERKVYGRSDFDFLERVFQKLLMNFSWWVLALSILFLLALLICGRRWTNRKDVDGNNIFEGGFLGLDNIGEMPCCRTIPGAAPRLARLIYDQAFSTAVIPCRLVGGWSRRIAQAGWPSTVCRC